MKRLMRLNRIVARGAIFIGTGMLALGMFAHGPDMTPGDQGLVHKAEAKTTAGDNHENGRGT